MSRSVSCFKLIKINSDHVNALTGALMYCSVDTAHEPHSNILINVYSEWQEHHIEYKAHLFYIYIMNIRNVGQRCIVVLHIASE